MDDRSQHCKAPSAPNDQLSWHRYLVEKYTHFGCIFLHANHFEGNEMCGDGRVVTARLPDELVAQMDEAADRIDRSKSWIVRQAVTEWLAEEQHRYELTLEALKSVDEGRTIPHEEVLARVEQRTRERRGARGQSAP